MTSAPSLRLREVASNARWTSCTRSRRRSRGYARLTRRDRRKIALSPREGRDVSRDRRVNWRTAAAPRRRTRNVPEKKPPHGLRRRRPFGGRIVAPGSGLRRVGFIFNDGVGRDHGRLRYPSSGHGDDDDDGAAPESAGPAQQMFPTLESGPRLKVLTLRSGV